MKNPTHNAIGQRFSPTSAKNKLQLRFRIAARQSNLIRMQRYLPLVIAVAVGVLTVTSGVVLYRKYEPTTVPTGSLKVEAGSSGAVHVRGPAKAPVTVEEFGDFQCPPCGMLAGPLKQIEAENSANVRFVFHNFPLITHAHAHLAAQAAEAAGLQGKFWEMHDLLYKEQPNWSKATDVRQLFTAYAGVLGLDVPRFGNDIDSPEVKGRVDADQKLGAAAGVSTTPGLFINREAVAPSSLSPDSLRKLIKEAVANSSKPTG